MRTSHLPTSVAISRYLSRQRQLLDPLRRGRYEGRCAAHSSAESSDDADQQTKHLNLPFRFETGIGLYAKRPPRPFPPPFTSPPSGSFSDPLSTHHRSRDRRDRPGFVNGQLIKGFTNGDDAVYANDFFICTNDGVGAWSMRPRGHAGLWSRLMLHFWASEVEEDNIRSSSMNMNPPRMPDTVAMLQLAYEKTLEATLAHDWQGTTTTCGAQLHYRSEGDVSDSPSPLLLVTNLGDCQVMVIRPRTKDVIFKTKEQWHWFDCPRQLGTNSPDTPRGNAVVDLVDLEIGDVVLALSDGVIDNLWEHEIVESIVKSIERWEAEDSELSHQQRAGGRQGGMKVAATDLVEAARLIATDPFAESPFMEKAVEEGLASEGGKRSKQYRKLMERYCMTFGFREPYQVLVDAEMVQDSCRFKMELEPALQRTAHGKVKPMITQCEIRKLYAKKNEPGINEAIEVAKSCERRRCGHHPDEYPEPLSTLECFQSVIDPKDTGENKHRYVVASQSQELRRMLRGVRGVPLIYIKRSVMILEPMSDESVQLRAREERKKFRAGIKPTLGKRKREDKDGGHDADDDDGLEHDADNAGTGERQEEKSTGNDEPTKKKNRRHGPKGPNPLSVKKAKKKKTQETTQADSTKAEDGDETAKRKRRRRTKPAEASISAGAGAPADS
ncbi:hypothetical protein E4U42_003872 [Claviceps africana]|uniref:U three protein 23 n=1 Tax=Claviceps africana TaxID=83212 RepID=A0A8K0J8U7_9HYPO|nr:hypothetical protein E4U42_003872 [Claviceps africana]